MVDPNLTTSGMDFRRCPSAKEPRSPITCHSSPGLDHSLFQVRAKANVGALDTPEPVLHVHILLDDVHWNVRNLVHDAQNGVCKIGKLPCHQLTVLILLDRATRLGGASNDMQGNSRKDNQSRLSGIGFSMYIKSIVKTLLMVATSCAPNYI